MIALYIPQVPQPTSAENLSSTNPCLAKAACCQSEGVPNVPRIAKSGKLRMEKCLP